MIQDYVEVVHLDQHEQIPWNSANGELLPAVRRLSGGRPFDIVTAAGEAARFAFAVAESGLARSVVFHIPSADRVLDETSGADLATATAPYLSLGPALLEAVQNEDVGQLRDVLAQPVREANGPEADAKGLPLLVEMYTDHAGEFLGNIQAMLAEAAADPPPPAPPWLEQPWIDRVATLDVPIVTVVAPGRALIGEVIARRSPQAEVVEVSPRLALTDMPDPGQFSAVLLRMLQCRLA